MAVFQAIGSGAGMSFRKARLLAGLWLVNVLYALAVVMPFFVILHRDFGHSALGERLGSIDFIWLGELVFRYRDVSPAILGWMIVPVFFYLLLSVFLNGGIIGRLLDRGGRTTVPTFFADCGRYFWRFLRLFLVSLLFYILIFGGILELLGALSRPWIENARTEWTVLILSNLHVLVALLLLTLVQLVFDYARIMVVRRDDPRALHALGDAGRFLGRRFFRAWFLYLLIGAIFIAGSVLYSIAAALIPESGARFLIIGILGSQVYIMFRIWIRLLFFSAQAEYYRMSTD